jgi:glutamate dehydrogenase
MDDAARPRPQSDLPDFLARAAATPGFTRDGVLAGDARAFLTQLREDASEEEFAELGAGDALALAHDFWTWTQKKDPEAQLVRLRAGVGQGGRMLDRDILEIAGPDMPFLVRSVMGEIAEQGLEVKALFHPLVTVRRDASGVRGAQGAERRESYIQVHLERLGAAHAQALEAGVGRTLRDVRLAVSDFAALKARMAACADQLTKARTGAPAAEVAEAVAFLRWLEEDNFTFLGARDYQFSRDASGEYAADEPIVLEETGLGLLRDPDRYVLRRGDEPSLLTPEIRRFLQEPTPLIVSKSNFKSMVHRRATADYIGVKRYDAAGEPVGETRFVGLFTADAYNEATRDIPLLRSKVAHVLARSGAAPGSHDYSVLRNILETYPRDELFQIGADELLEISLGVLHLTDRPRPRLFIRRDRFNRFVSALVFVPKDRFNSQLRAAIGALLVDHYGGYIEAFYPQLGEGPLARIHFLIQDIDRARPAPDVAALEFEIAALTRTWDDRFAAALHSAKGATEAEREALAKRFAGAFTAAYRERFDAAEALIDIAEIAKADAEASVHVRAYRLPGDGDTKLRCKLYARGAPLPLSAIMPVLENMGLFIEWEEGFKITPTDASGPFWIHDLDMRAADGAPLEFQAVEESFGDAFAAAWSGRAENDGFNRLILKLGVSWRQAALIRALARYRTQSGLDPSQSVQEQALAAHPEIVRQILGLFRVRFDPALPEPVEERRVWADQILGRIDHALNQVTSLDEDRVLRRIARLAAAILRTNFYQPGKDGGAKPYLSFKIESPALDDLPAPKPYREIWVWSPDVEGVHLRFGPVARGGLRWSDRRDDFRTEVLALAKAQQVKNAIIVPVGAKGGFFPKKLPRGGAPSEIRAAGVEAYKTYLRGLLDITDDIEGDRVVRPEHVVCWDGEDPYLVVAADKGTATFSDIANSVSAEYGFWLGDAFASGGSAGYDHKAMGITAKGAWEAVKRHFRELGVDIQTTPFDVIGVGDMSGDVFGNGMLLSKKIRLRAAFDHRDIFIDPDPQDLDACWAERKRLFDLPASSWRSYEPKLISKGGGVFSRQAKSIALTPEIARLTGLKGQAATPLELIAALLKAPCDLLWFGGIGTFVKAAAESHADVGDKANDGCRVNAEQVRAKVIGEGANLGVTQAGRIAFARRGGRINTDAVDNSAGVDTSDHEVNIKILLADALRTGALKPKEREPLLAAMTDDVAAHVLKHNYDQTLALSLSEAAAGADRDAHERMIQRLEREGKLDRAVEGLPSAEAFAELRQHGLGLARPELAKLIAYAKIDLCDVLTAGATPDDPHFDQALAAYFPKRLHKFEGSMRRHRLRREIIATAIADDTVNLAGPTFIDRVRDAAQTDAATAAAAFVGAKEIYGADALMARVNALDNKAPAAAQLALCQDIAAALRRATIALSRRRMAAPALTIDAMIARYREPVAAQRAAQGETLTDAERAEAQATAAAHIAIGAPEDLARDVAALAALVGALDVADLAAARSWPIPAAAALYHALGAALALDALRAGAAAFHLAQHWERLALRRLLAEINEDQRMLADAAIAHVGAPPARPARAWAADAVRGWLDSINQIAAPARSAIAEMQAAGDWSFAKIVLAAAALRALSMTFAAR